MLSLNSRVWLTALLIAAGSGLLSMLLNSPISSITAFISGVAFGIAFTGYVNTKVLVFRSPPDQYN